jgi:hypothetical protein
MSAYDELVSFLEEGEAVEAIVFGEFGWGGGYGEPAPQPVPKDKQGIIMSLEEARPMMQSWSFRGGFGAPDCYAVYAWTSSRVIWVHEYDGATRLSSAPRSPTICKPEMS